MSEINISICRFIVMVAAGFLMLCCNEESSPTHVRIRARNSSQFRYTNILIKSGDEEKNYGDLASKESSEYLIFEKAFQYASVRLFIGDHCFIKEFSAYNHEPSLLPGYYTYDILIQGNDSSYGDFIFRLIED